MIISIDGLAMPPYIEATPELMNRDSQAQTVSGRLVVELDPNPKWTIPISYEESALALDFQTAFYAKCFAMRVTPASITFVSPYDGQETTVTALCTEITSPEPAAIRRTTQRPLIYKKAGAVFQEI